MFSCNTLFSAWTVVRKHESMTMIKYAAKMCKQTRTHKSKPLNRAKGGFPLGEIFRPNRNFLLSYKHSGGQVELNRNLLNLNNRNFRSIENFD